jgi:multiple sugar transport system permease protein
VNPNIKQNSSLDRKATLKGRLKKVSKQIKDSVWGWIFVFPLVFGMLVFTLYPVVQSFIYSFHRYNDTLYEFIGFGNFETMLTIDREEILKVFSNTFLYALITVPLNLFFSYFLAVIVNQKLKGVQVFRVLYYLPVVIPGVISGVIFSQMFDNTNFGLFNAFFSKLGASQPFPFFTSASTAMFSAVLMNFWTIGASMILWLSALKNIPVGLYEAAKIDGAGVFTRVFKITIPLSTPMIFYNLITGIIGALQTNATMVYAPNGGRGPEDSLYFIAVKIYTEFASGYFGYASAVAWVLFVVIAILTFITFKTSKWVYTGDN